MLSETEGFEDEEVDNAVSLLLLFLNEEYSPILLDQGSDNGLLFGCWKESEA